MNPVWLKDKMGDCKYKIWMIRIYSYNSSIYTWIAIIVWHIKGTTIMKGNPITAAVLIKWTMNVYQEALPPLCVHITSHSSHQDSSPDHTKVLAHFCCFHFWHDWLKVVQNRHIISTKSEVHEIEVSGLQFPLHNKQHRSWLWSINLARLSQPNRIQLYFANFVT